MNCQICQRKQIENHENKSELSNILDRKPQNKSELSNSSAENRLKTTKKIWTFKYISGKQTENHENKSEFSNILDRKPQKILNFQIYQRKTNWKLQKNLNFQIYQRKTDWKPRKQIWTFKYFIGKQTENYFKISELSNISAENRLKITKKSLNFQIYQRKTDWKLREKSELSKISAENRLKTTKTNLNFQINQRKTDWKPRKQIWSFKYNRPKTTKKSYLSNISE